jgi:hypothetical protein
VGEQWPQPPAGGSAEGEAAEGGASVSQWRRAARVALSALIFTVGAAMFLEAILDAVLKARRS